MDARHKLFCVFGDFVLGMQDTLVTKSLFVE